MKLNKDLYNGELNNYQLPLGWNISFPQSFQYEYDNEEQISIFYLSDNDLTFRVSEIRAQKDGINAPEQFMREAYINSISKGMIKGRFKNVRIKDFESEGYIGEYSENGKSVYRVSFGIFTVGNLLLINIFSTNKKMVTESMVYINTVYRR